MIPRVDFRTVMKHFRDDRSGVAAQMVSLGTSRAAALEFASGLIIAGLWSWRTLGWPLPWAELGTTWLAWLDRGLLVATTVVIFWLIYGRRQLQRVRELEARRQSDVRELEDLRRAIDEHALISIADASGRITHANPKFCAVSGYSVAELVGRDHRIVNSRYHSADYFRGMWETIKQGKVWQGEIRNRSKDGRFYWVSSTIVPRLDASGRPFEFIAIRTDITQQKRLQQAADQWRERLERILDAGPTVTYAHEDSQQLERCTFISDNVEQLIGYPAAVMLAEKDFWLRHLHPGDRQLAVDSLRQLRERGEVRLEYRLRCAAGHYVWIRDTAKLVLGKDGAAAAIIGSWSDITANKSQEEELRRLRQAVNASIDMILITDAEGRIEFANPAFCRFTGWAAEEIVGQTVQALGWDGLPMLNCADLDEALGDSIMACLRRGRAWSGRLSNRRKAPTGEGLSPAPSETMRYWAEVSITPMLDRLGDPFGYISIQRDISAVVAEEARLAAEQEATETRLRIADLLHRRVPLEQRCAAVLDALFQLKGLQIQGKGGIFLRPEEGDGLEMFVLRGEFSEEFIRKEQRIVRGACLCGRAALSGELLISDDCFCDPRHEHRFSGMEPHGHYIVPLGESTDPVGVMFLYTDPYPSRESARLNLLQQVGQMLGLAVLQVRTEAALRRARDLACESARMKSAFLANMSHEIRTPMNGVLGMLELLRHTPLSNQQLEFVTTAHHSAEALLQVINDILDFSKIEAGKLQLESLPFDLRQLIEEVAALLAPQAHAKELEFNCFTSPDLPALVLGDPTRLRQILTNLVGNAVKFTERGEVVLEALSRPLREGLVEVTISVRDTGIGIGPETQARLFQPFIQADDETTRRFGGTGLGLVIARNLVERMGGQIGLESALGRGSKFWFTLPFELVAVPGSTPRTTELAGRRVLAVDDNATNRRILECILTNWGATVDLAEDGRQALDRLRAASYDLVILDLQMPGMDGLDLSRAISADARLRQVPRIMLSSGGVLETEDFRADGIHAVLGKPVRQGQLLSAAVSALNRTDATTSKAAAVAPRLPDFGGCRVLLVEDNTVNQKVALAILARLRVTAKLARDGVEALAALAADPYDLVLMDCQMPNLDGYGASQAWRERERECGLPRTPIIALTANALASDRDACLAAGMDDHLGKPFTPETLVRVFGRWLGQWDPVGAGQPIYDESEALRRLDGDRTLFEELIRLFVEREGCRQYDDLLSAWTRLDFAEVARVARAIGDVAAQLGADVVATRANALEQAARTADARSIDSRVTELAVGFRRLHAALRARLGSSSGLDIRCADPSEGSGLHQH